MPKRKRRRSPSGLAEIASLTDERMAQLLVIARRTDALHDRRGLSDLEKLVVSFSILFKASLCAGVKAEVAGMLKTMVEVVEASTEEVLDLSPATAKLVVALKRGVN